MNRILLWLLPNVNAITLAPFGIYHREEKMTWQTLNEELIHWKQQIEMIIIIFYAWYLIEWIIKYLTPPVGAYYDLSFEREAKMHREDGKYLNTRKHYAWFKYIKK